MSSQGVRIIKPLEDDSISHVSTVLLKKKTSWRPISFVTILFSSISAAFAAIVFSQINF